MTVVYIDVLFLLNLVVDYLLLLASARIAGERIVRGRIVLAALVGAFYAAAIFLPKLDWLARPICKLSLAVLMVLIAFGSSRRLLRLLLVFAGTSAALGGVVLALQLVGAGGLTLENGVLYTGFDLRILLVTVILCYAVLSAVFERAALHGGARRDLRQGSITIEGHTVFLVVLIDTGNTLRDPIHNCPVMVVDERILKEILPECADAADPVASMERMHAVGIHGRYRLLPYKAVGVAHGMLLAVQADKAVVGKQEYKGLLVALSPTPVSDGGGYQALIGEV